METYSEFSEPALLSSKAGKSPRSTHFAPAERATKAATSEYINAITHNPLINGLMVVSNGLCAVLNKHRQIVALNESFLKLVGIEDSSKTLGLRLGEYLHCVHACEMPAGCGTSPSCATCGATISIMAALSSEHPQEGTCAVTVERDGKEVDLFFQVRCCPVRIDDEKFILFFLNDISIQQQRANLDSVFFHDINNLLTGLLGKSEFFQHKGVWDTEGFGEIQKLIRRMAQEFSMQQAMTNSMAHDYKPLYFPVSVNSILDDLGETFKEHPLCLGKHVQISGIEGESTLVTDLNLVHRILVNMVTNALEATEPDGTAKIFVEPSGTAIIFCVWSRKHITNEHALQIFKRNFTTKEQMGHGLGTYSMKFFGEKILGGIVNFTTSESTGTTFRLTLMQQQTQSAS